MSMYTSHWRMHAWAVCMSCAVDSWIGTRHVEAREPGHGTNTHACPIVGSSSGPLVRLWRVSPDPKGGRRRLRAAEFYYTVNCLTVWTVLYTYVPSTALTGRMISNCTPARMEVQHCVQVQSTRCCVCVCVWRATSKARIWRCGGFVDGIVETRETSTLTSNRQADQQ